MPQDETGSGGSSSVNDGSDLLYQETRNGNDGEEPVRSETYDPVYNDSLLHDEEYSQ